MARKTGKTTQTWCTFPANRSDLARKSGSTEALMNHTPESKRYVTKGLPEKCKDLYLRYRFFNKIRQIHRIFDAFRQNPQILCRNQARLIQVLQVGYFSRRDDLLAMRVNLLATCSDLLAARTPHATCATKRSPHTARQKTAASPAIFKQHLNKNFY